MPPKTDETVKKLLAEAFEIRDEALEIRDAKVKLLEEDIESLRGKIHDLQRNVDWLSSAKRVSDCLHKLMLRKIDQNEQYSRKQNLIVNGMRIAKQDNDDTIRNKFLDEIERLKVNIQDFEVVRAHRTGHPYTDQDGNRCTSVIIRFSTWRSRDLVYQVRKSSRFFFSADLTEDRTQILKEAQRKIYEEGSLAKKLTKFVCADRNCNLMLGSVDGRFKIFNSIEEFDKLLLFIEDSQPPYAEINKLIESDKKQTYTGTKLVNVSDVDLDEWVKDPNHKYIGRAHGNVPESPWANPYRVQEHGRDKAILMYKEKVLKTPSLISSIDDLSGFQLGCWCTKDCHGQTLIDLLYSKNCA